MVHPVKTLVIGAKGFIGSHFYAHYSDVIGTHYRPSEGLEHLDLADPRLNFPIDGCRYAIISAGIGTPWKCQTNPDQCYQCDVEGILKLVRQLAKSGIIPVILSSTYALGQPENIYGSQKHLLEEAVIAELTDYLILRLEKVYGIVKGDGTFFDEMAQKLVLGECIEVATDQYLSPISIEEVVKHTIDLQTNGARGIYHFCAPQAASRYEMACYLGEKLQIDCSLIHPISIEKIDSIKRPRHVNITSSVPFSSWMKGIEKVANHYRQKEYDKTNRRKKLLGANSSNY